jgi:hypothetical protein
MNQAITWNDSRVVLSDSHNFVAKPSKDIQSSSTKFSLGSVGMSSLP